MVKRLLWSAFFLLLNEVQSELRDFDRHLALGLKLDYSYHYFLRNAMDTADLNRDPAPLVHRFSRRVNRSPGLLHDGSMRTSGNREHCDPGTA